MEFVDVSEAWRAYGAQQSLLRVKQPDYHLPAAASDAVAASAATPAAAASSSSSSSASSSLPSAPLSSFLQKSRIHFVLDELSLLHSLNPANAVLQSYDLVSVSTANEKVFHACCSHESVDLISLDSRGKQPFYLKKPMMNLALERGIHFEFASSGAIRDPGARRYFVANVMGFCRLTRGRNMVMASAAAKDMEMRAPWDIINLSATPAGIRQQHAYAHRMRGRLQLNMLGAPLVHTLTLFLMHSCCVLNCSAVMCGVDAAVAKASISANARAVLLHAEARKTIKCVIREIKAPTSQTAAAATHAASATGSSKDAAGGAGHAKPGVAESDQQKGKKAKFK